MIYPVQYVVRYSVAAGSYQDINLEDVLEVAAVYDARFYFVNTTTTTCTLRIQTTVSQSGVFSATVTDYNAAVALNSFYEHELGTLVKDSQVSHALRYSNGDVADRYLFGVLSGWTSIQNVLSSYVGDPS